ncbi:MAG: tetraacyldisaccharide 4'-kinase [Burkholderiaceae bacterium]
MPAGAALRKAWGGRGPLALALWPLSLVFRALAALRRGLYAAGALATHQAAVPVIVVGNVVAGGAGKTPIVIAIVRHLAARGVHCGVISRGHGRRTGDCREVLPDAHAQDTGDEPLLIRRAAGVPVFVARARIEAARALLAAHPQVQVIVSDDGLQHLALARDVEVCVFDERGVGNGWLLPAGPLREPWPREVDIVVAPTASEGVFGAPRRLAPEAVRADGSRVPLASLAQRPFHAVAAIAKPEAFFSMLRAAGVPPASVEARPDHDAFDGWQPPPGGVPVVCTEKDAVKLWRLHPGALAVPLVAEPGADFFARLDSLLARAGGPRLSSPDGHKTP